MSDQPQTMDASTLHLNEWFESLKRSGFTEAQAFTLVSNSIVEAQRQASGTCPQCHPE